MYIFGQYQKMEKGLEEMRLCRENVKKKKRGEHRVEPVGYQHSGCICLGKCLKTKRLRRGN